MTDPSTQPIRILIPSAIYTSNHKINNTVNRRSIFTAEERYEQLLAQLKDLSSLKLPGIEIYVLESSKPRLHHLRELSKYARVVLFYDTKGEYYANEHPVKSYFEFYSIYRLLRVMRSYKWMVKFGARYRPVGDPITPLLGSVPRAKIIPEQYTYTGKPIMNSVLFSFPYSRVARLRETLLSTLTNDTVEVSSESVFLTENTEHVPHLGIYGWDGIYSCVQIE